MPKSIFRAGLARMQFTLHATRRGHHGASRLVQAMSAWLVKTRRVTSRHGKDARVCGHTTTAMHKLSTPPPLTPFDFPPPPPDTASLSNSLFFYPAILSPLSKSFAQPPPPTFYLLSNFDNHLPPRPSPLSHASKRSPTTSWRLTWAVRS